MKGIPIEHSKLKKKKYKICGLSNKGAPGSEVELDPVFKEINILRKYDFRARPHPAKRIVYMLAVEQGIVISCQALLPDYYFHLYFYSGMTYNPKMEDTDF